MSIFPTQDSSGPSSTASALDSAATTAASTASAVTAAASTNTFTFPDSLDAQALFDELFSPVIYLLPSKSILVALKPLTGQYLHAGN